MRLLQGNEACAEGALLAGVRFFAGYPITPSSEIAEAFARSLPLMDGVFIQMEDEIAAMGAIIGASLAGKKAMTATSGPGFSLKQENIGYACMVEAPCTVVNVMRGGPSTGLPTLPSQADVMQAKWGPHGDHPAIVVVPGSVQESLWETIRAVNLAEYFRTVTIILLDEIIGHMREPIVIPNQDEVQIMDRKRPTCPPEQYLAYAFTEDGIPPLADFGSGYRFHVTGLFHDETGFATNDAYEIGRLMKRLMFKVENQKKMIEKNEIHLEEGAKLGIFSYGSTARTVKRVANELKSEGIPISRFRPITLWPFPDDSLREFAKTVDYILVPEMNLKQIYYEVERVAGCDCEIFPFNRMDGEPIRPNQIRNAIMEVVG